MVEETDQVNGASAGAHSDGGFSFIHGERSEGQRRKRDGEKPLARRKRPDLQVSSEKTMVPHHQTLGMSTTKSKCARKRIVARGEQVIIGRGNEKMKVIYFASLVARRGEEASVIRGAQTDVQRRDGQRVRREANARLLGARLERCHSARSNA